MRQSHDAQFSVVKQIDAAFELCNQRTAEFGTGLLRIEECCLRELLFRSSGNRGLHASACSARDGLLGRRHRHATSLDLGDTVLALCGPGLDNVALGREAGQQAIGQRRAFLRRQLQVANARSNSSTSEPTYATAARIGAGELRSMPANCSNSIGFSVPPAFGAFPNPLGDLLPGFPTDGGFGVVDASNHNPRGQAANDFMYGSGPVNRFVAEAGRPNVIAESVWPGGTSANPGSPFYLNLLTRYLTNDTVPLLYGQNELQQNLHSVSKFVPAK